MMELKNSHWRNSQATGHTFTFYFKENLLAADNHEKCNSQKGGSWEMVQPPQVWTAEDREMNTLNIKIIVLNNF